MGKWAAGPHVDGEACQVALLFKIVCSHFCFLLCALVVGVRQEQVPALV